MFFSIADKAQCASLSDQSHMSAQLEQHEIKSSVPAGKNENHEERQLESLSPEQTVDKLAAKSNNWQEPSMLSEERYKKAIREWLADMPLKQRVLAHRILQDAHPEMHALRTAIRDKKRELANMSFNRHTSPEALPRLGQELHNLRKQLRSRLELVSKRLRNEAGVSMGPLEGDAFWLQPQDIEAGKPKASNKGRSQDKSNSVNSLPAMFSMHF